MPVNRVMPNSLEAEQSVLGSMLLHEECVLEAVKALRPEDFYTANHRELFSAMYDLCSVNKPVDLVTVVERLEVTRPRTLEELNYLTELTVNVPYTRNIREYINIVREKSMLRKLIDVCAEVSDMAFEAKLPASEAVNVAGEKIYRLVENQSGRELVHIQSALIESYQTIATAAENKGRLVGLTMGFPILERALAGLQPSQLIIIAARTGIGKTSFALNVMEHVALQEQRVCAMFSLEMSAEQLATRLLCGKAEVNSQKARLGELRVPDDFKLLADAMTNLAQSRIYTYDNPSINVTEMTAQLRQLKRKTGDLGLVVIDYLQLMQGDSRSDNRQQQIAEITRGVKIMARELNVPVLLLSQLSREAAKGDTRPKLSHLRESGAIEQDADVVIFLHREGASEENGTVDENKPTIITIAKQRSGPTLSVDAMWIGEQTRYKELDMHRDDGYEE